MDNREHPNCRCEIVYIKIDLFDLPDQLPYVIGGHYPQIEKLLRLPTQPIKILWSDN